MFSTINQVMEYIKKHQVQQLDVKVLDLVGRWRRMTYCTSQLSEKLFNEGTGTSLSPYPGYRTVESGDMKIIPDISTAFIDPFFTRKTLSFICNMHTNEGDRYIRDPRYVLEKAEKFLEKMNLGGQALFSPEMEFYLFDNADYGSMPHSCYWSVESHGVGWGESDTPLYKISANKSGQIDQPLDRFNELREDMVEQMEKVGIKIKYHHHELGSPGQMEIEVLFDTPVKTADSIMLMRYFIKNIALQYGKLATFMPKPLPDHAGNSTHYHQYISNGEKSLFYDTHGYANLSKMALSYLAGQLHHTPALMGLGNASTNSYRRFSPNQSAPIKLFYGLSNRSSALRIPGYALNPQECRVEYRLPDATANPYLIMAAQLMAGLDGITKAMDPSAMGYGPYDINVFELSPDKLEKMRDIPVTFDAALNELSQDRQFLTQGEVFPDELIDSWLKIKRETEIALVHQIPHPAEYELYFDL